MKMEDMIRLMEEKEAQVNQETKEEERRKALRGKVGFVKLVWKEMPVDISLFI